MPVEADLLKARPYLFTWCPACRAPFRAFLRGLVQRRTRFLGILWRRPYCAVICEHCKAIVGWEQP